MHCLTFSLSILFSRALLSRAVYLLNTVDILVIFVFDIECDFCFNLKLDFLSVNSLYVGIWHATPTDAGRKHVCYWRKRYVNTSILVFKVWPGRIRLLKIEKLTFRQNLQDVLRGWLRWGWQTLEFRHGHRHAVYRTRFVKMLYSLPLDGTVPPARF